MINCLENIVKFGKKSSIQVSKNTKKALKKRLVRNNEIFQKKKQAKYLSMIVNDIEIFQKMKNKG